jgi:ubiquitin carboxyl-terminal hydrolase L3
MVLERCSCADSQYLAALGWPAHEYSFVDVLSTEDWALEMVPKPVLAVMLLFPIKEAVSAPLA